MASSDGAAAPSFLPLEGEKKSAKRKQIIAGSRFDATGRRKSAVLYIGNIPHGFYEDQMRGYFSQFGTVKRLRLSRNKKTGRSKHYAFVEFESPEVSEIVAESMDNYLMFGRILKAKIVPADKIHPTMWEGANRKFFVRPRSKIARELHNEDKDLEKRKRLVRKFLMKDRKRREKLKAMGYEYPQVEVPVTEPKKVVFEETS